MANFEGLLQSPWFNMGAGLLASDGRAEGLLTGMNQYNRNTRNAQAIQYQQAMMEQMQKKVAEEERQKLLREKAHREWATKQVPGMAQGAGPMIPGMALPQEPGMVPSDGPVMPGMAPPQMPGMVEGAGPTIPGMPQEQVMTDQFNRGQYDLLQGSPEYAQAYAQSQAPISEYQRQQLEIQRMNALKPNAPLIGSIGDRKIAAAAQDEIFGIDKGLALVGDLQGIVETNPEVVGAIGSARQSVGGVVGSIGENMGVDFIQDVGKSIAPAQKEAWDIKSGYLRAQLLPSVLNDSSRFSDRDMQLVTEAITITDNARSGSQAKEALGLIKDILKGDREKAEKKYSILTGGKPSKATGLPSGITNNPDGTITVETDDGKIITLSR